jgi:hypothetical protein
MVWRSQRNRSRLLRLPVIVICSRCPIALSLTLTQLTREPSAKARSRPAPSLP